VYNVWWRKSHEKTLSLWGRLNSLHHKTAHCFRKVRVFVKHSDTTLTAKFEHRNCVSFFKKSSQKVIFFSCKSDEVQY